MFQGARDRRERDYNNNRSYGSTNAISAPAQILCNVCKIVKSSTSFSNIKLRELAAHMAKTPNFQADKRGYTCCIGCTQKQVVELHCHFCDKDKGIDHFSKAQRKNPDHACCWECAKEREDMEPGESDNDISGGSRDDFSDDGDDEDFSFAATSSHAGGTTLPGTYSSRNTSGGGVSLPSTTGIAPSSVAPSSRASGWAIPSAASSTVDGGGFETVNNRSSKPAASSRGGFNPSKYKPAASVASSSRGRGQWAKIPAVKKEPVKKDSDESDEDDVYLNSDSD